MPDLRAKHLKELSTLLPRFADYWHEKAWLNGSDTGEHTLSDVFSFASHLVADRLKAGDVSALPKMLIYVESVLETGTREEQDAAATCFLENLLNRTPSKIQPELWIPLLGARSREFCRYWDAWTGCRTEYLHENPTR